ncbi:toxin ParE1 [Polymorphobacter multimanifer]|jgi:toxin ParE1/3/4|uniref:Toxin n=1 Tax=Polymorphobacter multimanifer TaxID=1070431 RepID=A0A841LI22_9SPHN|nr:type II toxin-antitoxin system RelE/ParE family toxin [Polymorphobacter multimanifer]MBB6228618.1 toxin ParE1/3/4 [Polymorphobacter multimanifer]GGI68804.1 toxin ParE1 [Polymorphobacter multimanifer]
MAEFRLSPAAKLDLNKIFDRSVAAWGLTKALEYDEALEKTLFMLARAPQRAQQCDRIRIGYRRQSVGSHVIYLKPTDYGIAVIRILHQRMDAARHL